MRVGLNSLFGNTSKNDKTEKSVSKSRVAGNGKSLRINGAPIGSGDSLKGEITNLVSKQVTIRLSDGQMINAQLSENMDINIGDELEFMVKETNGNQLTLSPISIENQENKVILNALLNAGLEPSEDNKGLVGELLENNMPINKDKILEMRMYTKRFPDAKLNEISFLMKNDILVSKDSLNFVRQLMNNNYSVSKDIQNFNSNVASIANDETGQQVVDRLLDQSQEGALVFEKVKNFMMDKSELSVPVKNDVEIFKFMSSEKLEHLLSDTKALTSDGLNNSVQSQESVQLTTSLSDTNESLTSQNLNQLIDALDEFSNKQGFDELFSQLEELNLPMDVRQATKRLLSQQIVDSLLNKELLMQKSDLESVEKLNDHYNKLYQRLNNVITMETNESAESVKQVVQEAMELSKNVEMMNQLQNNYQFVHLPVMVNDQNLNGQLYIMNQNKTNKNSQHVSALLQLDYRNLGHVDVYVAKNDNQIEIDFYLEDEETKTHVQNHVMELYSDITKLAFNILGLNTHVRKPDEDLTPTFFESNDDLSHGKFTFDVRA